MLIGVSNAELFGDTILEGAILKLLVSRIYILAFIATLFCLVTLSAAAFIGENNVRYSSFGYVRKVDATIS